MPVVMAFPFNYDPFRAPPTFAFVHTMSILIDMATKTAILNVRTDAATKKAAQSVFKRMGLDLSTGVNMYLTRVAQDKAMPFTPRTINGFTPEQEAQMLRELAYTEKYGKDIRLLRQR